MAKVRTTEDNISPASTFSGKYVTTIKDKEGTVGRARGTTRKSSRQKAEDDYDTKKRGS
jgi:hypothetical protein